MNRQEIVNSLEIGDTLNMDLTSTMKVNNEKKTRKINKTFVVIETAKDAVLLLDHKDNTRTVFTKDYMTKSDTIQNLTKVMEG